MIQGVSGMDEGVWFYDPMKDAWSALRLGPVRAESRNLTCSDPRFASAAAVCFIVSNLQRLMTEGGPDLYRLAHLEAGAAAQRLYLAAGALRLACCATGAFFDEDMRRFFGLDRTPWQPLHVLALGPPADEFAPV
jgi:SagB-type dehydrogenase family enzyme